MVFPDKKNLIRKSLYSIGILSLAFLASCKDDDAVEEMKSDSTQEKKEESTLNYKALFSSNHKIGVEEAKELALDAAYVLSGNDNGLKSGKVRRIEEVRVFHSEENSLRSGYDVSIPDTLAYLFNFADSAGYVIICADDRVGCPILACVDNGTLGEETDNPGLNIFLENAQVYMKNSILKFEEEKDSLMEVAMRNIAENDSLSENELRRIYTGAYTVIHAKKEVKPLLKTRWAQSGSPYNDFTKTCSANESGHAPAGCWAVAIGQVMAYYKYPPMTIEINTIKPQVSGTVLNWDLMTEYPDARDSNLDPKAKVMVTRLLRFIGRFINMDYDCDGSGAKSSDAMSFMESLGFSGCNTKSYSFSDVKAQLDNGRPVLMTGDRKKVLFVTYKGHAWVVDGYSANPVGVYCYATNTVTGQTVTQLVQTIYENALLHVNWGWGGNNNGYFAAGCFNCAQPVDFDYFTLSNSNTYNYQYDLEIHPVWR